MNVQAATNHTGVLSLSAIYLAKVDKLCHGVSKPLEADSRPAIVELGRSKKPYQAADQRAQQRATSALDQASTHYKTYPRQFCATTTHRSTTRFAYQAPQTKGQGYGHNVFRDKHTKDRRRGNKNK